MVADVDDAAGADPTIAPVTDTPAVVAVVPDVDVDDDDAFSATGEHEETG